MSIDPTYLAVFFVLVLEFRLVFTKLLVLRNGWSSSGLTIGNTSTSTSTSREIGRREGNW
jgi:hypothetical protein